MASDLYIQHTYYKKSCLCLDKFFFLLIFFDYICINLSFQTFQIWLDRWTPHTMSRWVFTVVLVCLFGLRIFMKQVRKKKMIIFLARLYQYLERITTYLITNWRNQMLKVVEENLSQNIKA